MMLEELKAHQPIAYRILENALIKNTWAHAYLFSGESGTPKKECAYLLAQSILCQKEGFACETCDTCKRVIHGGYSDLIYVDGNQSSIKKGDILQIQEQFAKTALETGGKKIYILDGVENATKEALNSLLKFLEEPQDDTLAILISEHSDRILETIVSRCQIIPFYKNNSSLLEEYLLKECTNMEAHILSAMCANEKQAQEVMESDAFQHAMYVFTTFLEKSEEHMGSAKVFLQRELLAKGKRSDKEVLSYFFQFLIQLVKDSYIDTSEQLEAIWDKKTQIVLQWKREHILKIAVESKDKIIRSANLALLVDQFLYKWEGYDE